MIAIYYKDQTITYDQLFSMIKEQEIKDPIFPVSHSLKDVIAILSCLVKGIPFFPYSNKLPQRPNINIPDDCDYILHTSGSSKMKYALFQKQAIVEANLYTHPALRLQQGDVYLLNLPLYHVAGLSVLMRAFLRGGAIAIEPSDPTIITHLSMVPAQTAKLLEETLYPKLKVLLLGGSKVDKTLADVLHHKGYPLFITYGMTEMSSHVTVEKYHPDLGVSFERFLPGRIVQNNEELLVKGPGKFIRYLDEKEQEFHKSGDVLEEKDGRYVVKKRKDNMFISGGENIHPEEIKRALLSHPAILNVTIKTIDHFKWGKRPFVSIHKKGFLTKQEVQDYLAKTLERFKIPKDHEIDLC